MKKKARVFPVNHSSIKEKRFIAFFLFITLRAFVSHNLIIKCKNAGFTFKYLDLCIYIYIYAFSRRFYPKRLTIAFRLYNFISMCVPWELNPQPFALLTQCSTTEPHRNTVYIECSCGSVVEHCISSAKRCGFNSQGTHILTKNVELES